MPGKERGVLPKPIRPYPIIAGPTASGKTAVAVAVAKALNGHVVSADSMQIYGDISVGTARPSEDEMQGVPHHLLGFLPLEEKYSVARYVEDANGVFARLFSENITPVLCGGTGLYIQSFMENVQFFPQQGDEQYRRELTQQAHTDGGAVLLEKLALVDPETAARLHENDLHRIIRALEVYHATGMTISEQVRLSHAVPSPYDGCLFMLDFRDRNKLYQRIEARVDTMLTTGLLEEVRQVMNAHEGATVLQAIGYKELLPYLMGECSLEAAVDKLKTETRHYAKRQLSWFRRMKPRVLYVDEFTNTQALSEALLAQYREFCEEE